MLRSSYAIRRVKLAVVMVVVSTSVHAQAPVSIFGQGVDPCSSWTTEHQRRTFKVGLQNQWVAGYLSGRNGDASSHNFLEGTDYDGVMAWVDTYCRSHPLEPIINAADAFADELISRPAQTDDRQRQQTN